VGWYQTDDDRRLMLTWGSTGGLTINEFAPIDGAISSRQRGPISMETYYLKEEYRVTFQRDAGASRGMQWADARAGSTARAPGGPRL